MGSFCYDVEYAKKHSIEDAIIESYCCFFGVSSETLDLQHLYDVTGLKRDVTGLKRGEVKSREHGTVSKPCNTQLFSNKTIKPTVKKSSSMYADAICKVLPSLITDKDLLAALDKWVRVIYKSGKGITKEQVVLAVDELKSIVGNDTQKALDIVALATQTGYKVFSWCLPTISRGSSSSALVHNADFAPRQITRIETVDEAF